MPGYFTEQEIGVLTRLGETFDVFLGRNKEDKETISRIELQKAKNSRIEVTYYEVYDEGSPKWLDLYASSFVNPDMNFETKSFRPWRKFSEA